VEWAGAVAPNATIDLVIAGDTPLENGLYLAMEHAVYGNVAPVMSLSFGLCEASLGTATNAFLNRLWEQAAAQGITVMVSAGDSGSAGCDNDNTEEYATQGQAVSGITATSPPDSTAWKASSRLTGTRPPATARQPCPSRA
jgi:subtilase family serine protease